MQPPTVAKPVPGATAGIQPIGANREISAPMVTPASTSATPPAGSKASTRSRRVVMIVRPPLFSAASP